MPPLDLDACILSVGRLLESDLPVPIRRAARRATVRLMRLHPGGRDAVSRVRARVEAELALLMLLSVLQEAPPARASPHLAPIRAVLEHVRAPVPGIPARSPRRAPAPARNDAIIEGTVPTRALVPGAIVLETADVQFVETAPQSAVAW